MDIVKQLEMLVDSAMNAADALKSYPGNVRVVSHYDADGIASAAILVKALERQGMGFRLSFVKQLSEDIITELGNEDELLYVFADLGSGFLNEMGEHILGKGKKAIILDHHQVQGEIRKGKAKEMVHVNPVLFGIEEEISGSGVCYLMARAMSPVNKDLSELAIIGAIGDSQTGSIGPDWGLMGINREILKDAQSTGKIAMEKGLRLWGRYGRPVHKALQYSMDPFIPDVSGSESGSVQFLRELGIELKGPDGGWRTLASLTEEETRRLATGIIKERIRNGEDNPEWIFGDVYELKDKEEGFRDANEFATMLNACGKSGNAWMGVGLCLNDEGFGKDVRRAMDSYRRDIGKAVDMVRKRRVPVRVEGHGDYILAGSSISEHLVSNVASIIEKSCLVPEESCHRPVFAMADTEDGMVKVSGRASDGLVKRGLNMKDIMAGAAEELGGQGGGHPGAGGATIPKGSEERFINTAEKLLSVQTGIKGSDSQGSAGKALLVGQENKNIKQVGQNIENAGPEARGPAERGKQHGNAEHEGAGAQGKEERGEEGREERGQAKGRARGSKEMERKGLVRYLFSQDVR